MEQRAALRGSSGTDFDPPKAPPEPDSSCVTKNLPYITRDPGLFGVILALLAITAFLFTMSLPGWPLHSFVLAFFALILGTRSHRPVLRVVSVGIGGLIVLWLLAGLALAVFESLRK